MKDWSIDQLNISETVGEGSARWMIYKFREGMRVKIFTCFCAEKCEYLVSNVFKNIE